MGQTAVYQLPYPDPPNPADVPADLKLLADKIDTLLQPPVVTTLPASPVNGQEVYLAPDANHLWHLRYKADIADAYKWVFVGGAPVAAQQTAGANQTTAAASTYVAMTNGPTITPPCKGYYDVRINGGIQMTIATLSEGRVTPMVAGAAAGLPVDYIAATQFACITPSIDNTLLLSAVAAISLGVSTNNTTVSFGVTSPWRLLVTPNRLSA